MTVEPGHATTHSRTDDRPHDHHHGVDADDFRPEMGTDGTLTEEPYHPNPSTPTADRMKAIGEVVVLYAICIAAALGLSALLVEVTGGSASEVFNALLDGSIRGPGRIGATIGVAVPLLLVAIGTIVSNRAGLVNIGQ
ncbi:MAG: hypothetical protein KDB37_21370, partial [Ilumatobacter sp.]|nr:hypothetical protein [Ilumatobacter sp.]